MNTARSVSISNSVSQRLALLGFLLIVTHPSFTQREIGIGNWQVQTVTPGTVQDYYVPEDSHGATFNVRLEGADGGRIQVRWAITNLFIKNINGGSGATIRASFRIGLGTNEIPPGSLIRMIVGEAGESVTMADPSLGVGGGGGTAILFKAPDASLSEFVLLAVAGGGGGAAGDCCANDYKGRSAETGTSGSGSNSSWPEFNKAGGSDGNGGEADDGGNTAGAGGGAFTGGQGDCTTCNGGAGGGTYDPQGGRGGKFESENLIEFPGPNGGYGYGGGGQGYKRSAGGGGGYSGGGAANFGTNARLSAGGGGGSYVNEDYAFNIQKIKNPSTSDIKNGWIDFQIDYCPIISNVAVEFSNCTSVLTTEIESCHEGRVFTYVQRNSAGAFLRENDTGVFTPVAAGDYIIEVYEGGTWREEFMVTVAGDPVFPTARCKDFEAFLESDGSVSISTDKVDGGSTDNCRLWLKFRDPNIGFVDQISYNDYGTYQDRLYVYDANNNLSTCDFTVVVDQLFPNGCDAIVPLGATGVKTFNAEEHIIQAPFDRSETVENLIYTWDYQNDNYDCADIGQTFALEVTVEDENGYSNSCTSSISVVDTIPPTVICQDVMVELEQNGTATFTYDQFISSVFDNCLSASEIINSYGWDNTIMTTTVSCTDIGDHEITLLGSTDPHGNTLPECTAVLQVRDKLAPIINCWDIEVTLDAGGTAVLYPEDYPIAYSDNCSAVEDITVNTPLITFNCLTIGSFDFSVTARDEYGNNAECTFAIEVKSVEQPLVKCKDRTIDLGSDLTEEIIPNVIFDGIGGFCNNGAFSDGTLSFEDGTDPVLTIADIGPGRDFVLVYTPNNGDPVSTCTARVQAIENVAPTRTCPGTYNFSTTRLELYAVDGPDLCGSIVEYNLNASDNIGLDSVYLKAGLNSGALFPYGETDVEWVIKDASGNSNNCLFTVIVENEHNPRMTCPSDYSIELEAGSCNAIIDTIPQLIDVCPSISISQTSGTPMGSSFARGTHNFQFVAENSVGGEFTSCFFRVSVIDIDAPVAICKDTTVTMVGNSMLLDPQWLDNGSYDACSNVTFFVNNRGKDCDDFGPNNVTLRVIDGDNNFSTCRAVLTIVPECQDIEVELDATGNYTLAPSSIYNLPNNCNLTDMAVDQSLFHCEDTGPNQVVLTVTTTRDRTAECTSTVTVMDPVESCLSILPVTLSYFQVESLLEQQASRLNWATSSEINNEGFIIEHSLDGLNWVELHFVEGAGNTSSLVLYEYIHESAPIGVNYYRLKQVDFDRTASYSDIRVVEIKSREGGIDVQIFPNPTQSLLTIDHIPTRSKELRIISASGEVMLSKKLDSGQHNLKLEVGNMPAGIYYIKIIHGTEITVKPFIKE